MKLSGGVLVGTAGENIGDLIVGGKKPLHLPRRLVALHDPLASSGRLMRILCPVVEALVLPVLNAGYNLPLGRGVALQLVGDEHTRGSTLLSEKLAEQAFGGLLVATALHEDVENEPLLIARAPEPMLLAGDGDDDLIQVPLVAALGRAPTNAVGELAAKFEAPLPDRLIGHRDAASRQHLLNHAQAQREPKIQPDRVADDLSRVSIAGVNWVSRRRHPARLPDQLGFHQACSRPTCRCPPKPSKPSLELLSPQTARPDSASRQVTPL